MTLLDLYKVIKVDHEVIIRDHNQSCNIVYRGKEGHIPNKILNNNVRWIYASDESIGIIEIVIE